jgi:hypothetical protein
MGAPYLPVACASAPEKPQVRLARSFPLGVLEDVGTRTLLGLANLSVLG